MYVDIIYIMAYRFTCFIELCMSVGSMSICCLLFIYLDFSNVTVVCG